MTSSWIFLLIKPSGVEAGIFKENWVNIMVADGLAPCSITRPPELIVYGPKFARGKIKTVLFQYGKNNLNMNIVLYFPEIFQPVKRLLSSDLYGLHLKVSCLINMPL